MRVARVLTNETCNQNCAFCNARRPVERSDFVRTAATRIEQALDAGARELVLTGGEPTLRRDLATLVEQARRSGAERVALETNAALVDREMAEALARAGLEIARVHLPAWGDGADAISEDPGGFGATLAGMVALSAAGIRLEAAAPIVKQNLALVARLPEEISTSGLPIEALVLGVPVDAPDRSTLASLGEAAGAIEAVQRAARAVGLALRFEPNALIPPCVFRRPARVAHLYALSPGGGERPGYAKVRACSDCRVSDRC